MLVDLLFWILDLFDSDDYDPSDPDLENARGNQERQAYHEYILSLSPAKSTAIH